MSLQPFCQQFLSEVGDIVGVRNSRYRQVDFKGFFHSTSRNYGYDNECSVTLLLAKYSLAHLAFLPSQYGKMPYSAYYSFQDVYMCTQSFLKRQCLPSKGIQYERKKKLWEKNCNSPLVVASVSSHDMAMTRPKSHQCIELKITVIYMDNLTDKHYTDQ